MENGSVKISAIICTHNPYKYLHDAVKSLVNQSLSKELYEIIIVDNASSSNVKALIEEFLEVPNLRFSYETTCGLSQARNRGWREAKGEYVAYLDDDAIASLDWLKNILDAFGKTKIKLGCVGGKIEPIWESPKPQWLCKELEAFLSVLDYSDSSKILDKKQNLFGTNIAFPKKILNELSGFNTTLGRKGESLISGEEALLQKEIRNLGYKVLYDPKIIVSHRILKSRLSKNWFIKRMYYEGISNALIELCREKPSKLNKLWLIIKEILCFTIPLKEMLYHLISNTKPKWFYYRCLFTIRVGYISRMFGLVS